MKKPFAILAALVMLIPCAFAETPDFPGMTQSEILDVINAGRNAIVLQETEDGLLRYDTGYGIVILFQRISDRITLGRNYIDVLIVNDSDVDYAIRCDSLYINGWLCDNVVPTNINAHRRANDQWSFALSDANLESVDQIEEMEFALCIYPQNGKRSRDALDIEPAIIVINRGD